MAHHRPSTGLHTIFAIFLGLMVTAFVGVGVYTFYPPPDANAQRRVVSLAREEEAIRNARAMNELTRADRDRIQAIATERNALQDSMQSGRAAWGRTTSIILIALATLAMTLSIVRADQLPVISSGLLLGGVFTMIYGVGWVLATDTSIARFVVITLALAITLTLGYVRFVRGGARVTTHGATLPADAAAADLERRVRSLEERLDETARALGRRQG